MGFALKPNSRPSATTHWMIQNPISSKLVSILSLGLAFYFLMQLSRISFWVILPVSAISLLYIQSMSEGKNLREVPLLKIFLIALVWTLSIVILPLLNCSILDQNSIIILIGFFLFMMAQIIPFDIRDINNDRLDDLKTIPILLEEKKSKWIAIGILFISSILMMIALNSMGQATALISFLLSSIYLTICLLRVNNKQADYFYSFFTESSLILPYLISEFIGLLWS